MLTNQKFGVTARNQGEQQNSIGLLANVQPVTGKKHYWQIATLGQGLNHGRQIAGSNEATSHQ